ncbi:uncharacterized protein A1O9_08226 [Exophiala aquamarina CBS 119918]|uniref:Phosphatidylethanolamine-binding protein n=1 Tax=Exophiala aquamarina CBS 119918 TaxID=1182545 RepID=A0A072P6I3_9EURO|nr:uncharacterized protein A1O9_08226 [Exophiala aquamarina CBS 119918]KEF55476.1 hypothetical protein A1O9_08226 [Exophiala aquamarina CBS 119918]
MKYSSTFLVPALAAVVNAQTAPDFPVQVDTLLVVDYQNTSISVEPAGVTLNRDDILETPVALGQAGATKQSTYILFMVDQDVEATPGEPRVQLLHYFQPNLFGSSEVLSFDAEAENATTAVGATYIPPTPPAGDGPHRYNLLLYIQPEGFTVPSQFASIDPPADVNARIGFDMAGFAEAAGLGAPISGVWFQVENNEGGSSGSTSSGSASATTSGSESTSTDAGSATTGGTDSTATQTQESSTTSGSSTSATGASSTGNAAGMLDARSENQKALLGLSVLAGAAFWMF